MPFGRRQQPLLKYAIFTQQQQIYGDQKYAATNEQMKHQLLIIEKYNNQVK